MDFDPSSITPDYGDPQAEAVACRTAAALFDFSFMSRAILSGPGAVRAIGTLTRRRIADMRVGAIRYAVRETLEGYLAADLTIWRVGSQTWEVMSGRPVDIADLAAAAADDGLLEIRDLTAQTRIFAVQGPRALAALCPHLSPQAARRLAALPYYASGDFLLADTPVRIGRLGYTGERGFELVLSANDGDAMWQRLAADARPAGFIATDMLRIEAGFVLFANEFRVPVTSAEAGLCTFSDGGAAIEFRTQAARQALSLVSFRAATDADVTLFRPQATLARPQRDNELIITSACNSQVAGGVLGLGYVRSERGPRVAMQDPTGTFHDIELVSRPYYDPEKRRPRAPWD
ncbi:MAG TPA: hypothetical protein P5114_05460 [Hyphomicrobiaceae bacterium]|nr:hypothetical protein [Hyphomicrobiaceae bacterium]